MPNNETPESNNALNPSSKKLDRREVFCGTIAAISAATIASSSSPAFSADNESSGKKLEKGSVILFQGDSITDAGRERKNKQANQARAFGRGYPMTIGGGLLSDHPSLDLKIYNRGISGNKVPDLDKRWQADCIDLKPNLLSILIGVNDIWHMLTGNYKGTVKTYESGLKALLERTKAALPEIRIVICEPFVLKCGAVNDKWFPEFDQRREACLAVAKSMSLEVVPFQNMFNLATEHAPPKYWAADGVHPSMAGHALMAKTWREVVGV